MATENDSGFDLEQISHLWNQGSVIRSWLLELAEAIERNVPAPVITQALFERFRSRQQESFAAKVIAALRDEFGGHGVKGA